MDNNYSAIVREHMMKRMMWLFKLFAKAEIGCCVIIFAVVQLAMRLEGQFYPLTWLILLIPFFLLGLLYAIFASRAALNTRPGKLKTAEGYLVDLTEYINHADEETIKMFSNVFSIRQDADAMSFVISLQLTKRKWLKGAKCFSFINADFFDANYQKWADNPEFDLAVDVDVLEHFVFFVFDEELAENAQAWCSQWFTNPKYSFCISPKCTATYANVKNVDEILLDIASL